MARRWDNDGKTTWDENTSGNQYLSADDLNDTLSETQPPIGAIIAWCKTIAGVPALQGTWVECNGGNVADANSPINGEPIPNINGSNYFLRGAATSGATGGAATHTHTMTLASHTAQITGSHNWHSSASVTSNAVASLPTYGNVVYIMRIK